MTAPFLAVEAGGSNVPVIILIVALVGFGLAYFFVGPGRRRGPRRNADIPLAMRPYHSDEELEGRGMERAMAWGVALAVFASLFIPLYWLIEPDRINRAVDDFYAADVDSGRVEYQNACAACHGENLSGGSAPHPDPDVDTAWPAPALDNVVARYQGSEVVEDVREFLELSIVYGRPGTPMPAFSVGQGGTLSDNQVNQIITYILSVQTGELPEQQGVPDVDDDESAGAVLFENNCARCHGQQLEGGVGPQLLNVYERYGWSGEDDGSLEEARAAVVQAVRDGRFLAGNAPMPPFEQVLTDEAIDAVVDHVEQAQVTGGPSFASIGGTPSGEPEENS